MTNEFDLSIKIGNWAGIPHYHTYTYDIRACLDHLGPKFTYIDLYLSQKDNLATCELEYEGHIYRYEGSYAEGLALAFCRAAEQVVDKGAKV